MERPHVTPPRYPTPWEVCVNAIVFQQITPLAVHDSSVARSRALLRGAPPVAAR